MTSGEATLDVEPDGHIAIIRSNFLGCPNCGSDDVSLRIWGEGVDANIECRDCGERMVIR